MPKFGFLSIFTDDYYSFSITWRLENTVSFITEHQSMTIRSQPNKYSYVKHLISDVD